MRPATGLWISGQPGKADLTTSPQAQQHQQKRSIRVLHKPDNLISYRQAIDEEGLRDNGLKVLCGGAPVTEAYAKKHGSDGFAADAASAANMAKQLIAAN